MLTDILFPRETGLQLDEIHIEGQRIDIKISSTQRAAICPQCNSLAERIHSCYQRKPADLPIAEQQVRLLVKVQRFFCDTVSCIATTFAERLPGFLEPYARRTNRLSNRQQHVAFSINGKEGSRLLDTMKMPLSHDSLIRMVRMAPEIESSTPRVLGIDDWCKRKGQNYGTILVDLERHRVVDVLDDRSAKSVAEWLEDHPDVEIISRDRGKEYAQGAKLGAPDAEQVADRWHLLQNLREALERWLDGHRDCLRAAAESEQAELVDQVESTDSAADHLSEGPCVETGDNSAETTPSGEATPTLSRLERFNAVHELHNQGLSIRAISRQLGIHRATIRKYLKLTECPGYSGRIPSPKKLDPWLSYFEERWESGHQNGSQLWRELCELGFDGSRGVVARWAAAKRATLPGSGATASEAKPKVIAWSARRASWLLMRSEEESSESEHRILMRMIQTDTRVQQVYNLGQRFLAMIRERQPECLDPWFESVEESNIGVLKRFARGIKQDLAAVRNALSLPWSQGQVEGQVNRLKLVKRSMYGRANFDLLRKKVMGHSL